MSIHPKLRSSTGQAVEIAAPHCDGPAAHWEDASRVATVTPLGAQPATLHGIPLTPWLEVPTSAAAWARVPGQAALVEPPFRVPPGMRSAAGVVVREADGRLWLVSPTNRFGGYANTFPKGTRDDGLTLQATAIKEAFEESGLQVEITGFLLDATRTASHTRYYLARRVGGSPAEMGWESQAVHLVPPAALADFLTHPSDAPLLAALAAAPA